MSFCFQKKKTTPNFITFKALQYLGLYFVAGRGVAGREFTNSGAQYT